MRIEFFEPPMCCPTGICGPSVDQKLVQLNENIQLLKNKYPGIIIERYMINRQPLKFQDNPEVLQLVQDQGMKALPITTINGNILKYAQYPELTEIEQSISGGQ
ncbi:arsenite efflux transporter metallochaperone ArsD [Heliobacterium chlorum]|uniref:Arsenite efflux transporter metallochaperone ArsD n=1 Tax=Heliobacterium chlorum TaxID=2698 RepID=A0ABR7T2V3_HELCL|nr:arsenite efflux transporter metallochaperone ArsD [Heliobacterium chlorum]MBC9784315.1 arsenite efflux transporter metallochaperone ArsD [Heliobacterium chlorum]